MRNARTYKKNQSSSSLNSPNSIQSNFGLAPIADFNSPKSFKKQKIKK